MSWWAHVEDNGSGVEIVMETFEFPTDPTALFVPGWVWVECPADTQQQATYIDGVFTNPPPPPPPPPYVPPLWAVQAEKTALINAKLLDIITTGAPVVSGGLTYTIPLNFKTRIFVNAMHTAAVLANSEVSTWPAGYSKGIATNEGPRLALPTAADGLTMAARVSNYFADANQQAFDLKEAVNAATENDEVDAIDITTGWPV